MALNVKTVDPLPEDIESLVNQRIEAAVAARVSEATEALLNKLAARQVETQPDGGMRGLTEGLAMALAELSDQGTGQKRLPPEVVRRQADARGRMERLLAAAAERGEMPTYAVMDKVYFSDRIIDPVWKAGPNEIKRTEIGWPHAPNKLLRPLNAAAQEIYEAFTESIGGVGTQPTTAHRVGGNGVVYTDGRTASLKPPIEVIEPTNGVQLLNRGAIGQRVPKHVLGTVVPPAMETHLGQGL